MSGELVPQGMPYGERQTTEAGMALAGAPTSLNAPQARPISALARTPQRPVGFDPLLELQPVAPQDEMRVPSFREKLEESLVTSSNPLMREAARRILGVK